jgi:hypothetical protein
MRHSLASPWTYSHQAHGPHMQTNVLARALELPIVVFLVCTGAE